MDIYGIMTAFEHALSRMDKAPAYETEVFTAGTMGDRGHLN